MESRRLENSNSEPATTHFWFACDDEPQTSGSTRGSRIRGPFFFCEAAPVAASARRRCNCEIAAVFRPQVHRTPDSSWELSTRLGFDRRHQADFRRRALHRRGPRTQLAGEVVSPGSHQRKASPACRTLGIRFCVKQAVIAARQHCGRGATLTMVEHGGLLRARRIGR